MLWAALISTWVWVLYMMLQAEKWQVVVFGLRWGFFGGVKQAAMLGVRYSAQVFLSWLKTP